MIMSPPPILHNQWSTLREKLLETDGLKINRRIGNNYTIVVELDPLKYDPDIPIISKSTLDKWWRARLNKQTTACTSKATVKLEPSIKPAKSRPPKTKKPITTTTTTSPKAKIKKARVIPIPEPSPTRLSDLSWNVVLENPTKQSAANGEIKDNGTTSNGGNHNGIDLLNLVESSDEYRDEEEGDRDADNDDEGLSKTVLKCEIDGLVINEPIDDEFAMYDDGDSDCETVLTKNLKKIRTVPTPAPPKQPQQAPKSSSPKKTPSPRKQPKQQAAFKNLVRSRSPSPVVETRTPQQASEPNWAQISKELQTNQFTNVFKGLNYFKDRLKSDNTAKALPKDLIMKCLQEDETNHLVDTLELIYELDYKDDWEFWTELVLRLKRKLNSHTQVKSFKSKTNPEQVYQNYKRAISSISRYSDQVNLTMKLPHYTFRFFDEAFRESEKAATLPHNGNETFIVTHASNNESVAGPTQPINAVPSTNCNQDNSRKSSTTAMQNDNIKREPLANGLYANNSCKFEKSQPQSNNKIITPPDVKPTCKTEVQPENVNPANVNPANQSPTKRRVVATKNQSGQLSFKITKPKIVNKPSTFKLRL